MDVDVGKNNPRLEVNLGLSKIMRLKYGCVVDESLDLGIDVLNRLEVAWDELTKDRAIFSFSQMVM